MIILDICKEDRTDVLNLFHLKRVAYNLPTDTVYDASIHRVTKIQEDEELACGENIFADDIHVSGRRVGGGSLARRACKMLKAQMNHLGNQADDLKY